MNSLVEPVARIFPHYADATKWSQVSEAVCLVIGVSDSDTREKRRRNSRLTSSGNSKTTAKTAIFTQNISYFLTFRLRELSLRHKIVIY